jgi:hypothetical protein
VQSHPSLRLTDRYGSGGQRLTSTGSQRDNILWSDETWVTGGRHRKLWVTRRIGEEYEDTCIVEKVRHRSGWMFCACFSGALKGPHLFWEKEWKTINKESYCDRIVPLIDGWIRQNPHLQFMQDGPEYKLPR